ncbi:hypothetical protein RSK20926_18207 [Roseobacter sp. SK209-2-6]|uniref:hypothetical protein n=1 Tax=Roseobacter sp. SK209-2-6 TaxID=388739 RepID=UPI0000F3F589|nr:hypothetical protein [Roseobacter sp. SK209-2-6]EBA17698.1 hypothetical protein RSK20926_18207 [Roseobacter sp. SK209-2-6]
MHTKPASLFALCLSLWLPLPAGAQAPLTVIDWLGQPDKEPQLPDTVLLEAPVTGSATQPQVTVTPLQALLPPIGLVSPTATGLPLDLWAGSEAQEIARLIRTVPVQGNPALQSLLFTLLLSESRPLQSEGDAILLSRLDRLIAQGATDPAQALVEQAGPAQTPERFKRWFFTTLLSGDEDRACASLTAAPHLSNDYRVRIFCSARRGDWPTAALLLEAAHALELLSKEELNLLDRFLNPDVFELAPPLPLPSKPDPLTFRLFETIGEPLPTAPLPRVFAAADLRDVAGWKAQLEAAERLTRAGALNPNQLLGLYTERRPAASGGVWDRVAALQSFEKALESNDSAEIATALPEVWQAMQSAGLEIGFADLFAEALARFQFEGEIAALAWRIELLAPSYEIASHRSPDQKAETLFLAALAQGRAGSYAPRLVASEDGTAAEAQPLPRPAPSPLAHSIALGFSDATRPPAQIQALLDNGQLGEAILRSMTLFSRGAAGNLGDLTQALAALRAIGLEDTARRAALQLMLLERG